MKNINWKIAGRAGEGIMVTGAMFAKTCVRHGMNIFNYFEYPSLIRGGHNTAQIYASYEAATCQKKLVDVLVALNEDGIKLHLDEMDQHSVVLVDVESTKIDPAKYAGKANLLDIPMVRLAREATGASLASNVVTIGASCALLGLDVSVFQHVIQDIFVDKGEEVVKKNQDAATKGYEFVVQLGKKSAEQLPVQPKGHIVLTGNDAIGMGSIAAGVQFYAAYPMTPTSSLLHFMADQQKRYPIVVKHAEDEISAINMAIGASYAGVRSMTGTAGGGFALMVEGVSLAGVAETPLVVVEGQRPGPATGLPTWTCQADLQFVMRSGHGEFPKVVFTPGDVKEAFLMTKLAFYLAEKYHTQVIIIGDKYMLESSQNTEAFSEVSHNQRYSFAPADLPADGSYKRFLDTEEGYSPRSIPGQKYGLQLTNSYEHDEHGYATEDALMTKTMVDKRLKKLKGLLKETPAPELIGPAEAELTFVCWGSTSLVLREVVKQLNTEKPNWANIIHLQVMMPFHSAEFTAMAGKAKRLVMVEGNVQRQAEAWIREQTGIVFKERINRYDGRPFYYEEIIEWVKTGTHA